MTATIIIGTGIAVLFVLAVRHIVKQHKEGGCCGSCRDCHGCELSYEEVKGKQSPEPCGKIK